MRAVTVREGAREDLLFQVLETVSVFMSDDGLEVVLSLQSTPHLAKSAASTSSYPKLAG